MKIKTFSSWGDMMENIRESQWCGFKRLDFEVRETTVIVLKTLNKKAVNTPDISIIKIKTP